MTKVILGLDTNVLVRYIVQDDPEHSKYATQFIEALCKEDNTIFISGIVLCELVWVLESAYEYPKKNIVEVLEKILRTREFCIHQPEVLWNAFHDYKKIAVDFSDSYIAYLNHANQCKHTVTFDKKATRLSLFKLLTKQDF
jgi:predicted nucleic-acid-binding protein